MTFHFKRIALKNFKCSFSIYQSLVKWCSHFDRRNEVQIQMIDEQLRKQLFGKNPNSKLNSENLNMIKQHLRKHGLWESKSKNCDQPVYKTASTENVYMSLPTLKGSDIEEHFATLGKNYAQPYRDLGDRFAYLNVTPKLPSKWQLEEGWTRYEVTTDGKEIMEKIDYPKENALIFDIEVCLKDGNGKYPTMAVCLSPHAWYSWCSQRLIEHDISSDLFLDRVFDHNSSLNHDQLIPMGVYRNSQRLLIGHNVSFDRSFIKEQYYLECDQTRFMDTMSLHICNSGLTGYQRALSFSYKVAKKSGLKDYDLKNKFESMGHPDPGNWEDKGSLNNLADVYKFHCQKILNKEPRDLFIKGSLTEIYDNFQELMNYCAQDVKATYDVFCKVWPLFLTRFPHPVTLAGMLEMSVMYLPVNISNWERYLNEAQNTYDDLEREVTLSLQNLANEACSLIHNESYKKDVWLWDLDWSTQTLRFRKNFKGIDIASPFQEQNVEACDNKKIKMAQPKKKKVLKNIEDKSSTVTIQQEQLTPFLKELISTKVSLNKVQPLLPGYPAWYRELCDHPFGASKLRSDENLRCWEPGPSLISTQIRSTPKLLRLLWNGYPLHFDEKNRWGYLVPNKNFHQTYKIDFPLLEFYKVVQFLSNHDDHVDSFDPFLTGQEVELIDEIERSEINKKNSKSKLDQGINMFGCKYYKLPHKNGPSNNVGNPLGKEYLRFLENGNLTTYSTKHEAKLVLQISKALSYWKMSNKRIYSQMVATINEKQDYGALLPRVIVAGTITRRAVEPTWLTASNAYEDRVGSELKAMIQVPKGYKFVGADVDSQELWIASLIGDSHFAGIHGCTAIGWMTLQGSKLKSSDMHSKIASMVGISRDQAKILNYGRIYGAGSAFATRFLKQSNDQLSEKEAKAKALKIYRQTKGMRVKKLNENNSEGERVWVGGSESEMFNKLESIALSSEPATPVLDCKISTALSSEAVKKDFLTSVINWVVQSSGVDYLHLMLVNMKWLFEYFNIDGRFCISIHDEVRYMVKEKDQYKLALALQITNLMTRAMFSSRLGMYDLPQSVAFFSSIDIDSVLRKEVYIDCKTPSNPHGLKMGYNIDHGQSIDIYQLLEIPEIKELVKKPSTLNHQIYEPQTQQIVPLPIKIRPSIKHF